MATIVSIIRAILVRQWQHIVTYTSERYATASLAGSRCDIVTLTGKRNVVSAYLSYRYEPVGLMSKRIIVDNLTSKI